MRLIAYVDSMSSSLLTVITEERVFRNMKQLVVNACLHVATFQW